MKYFNITNDKLSDELRQFLSDEDKDNLAAEKTVLDIKKDFLERRFTALADYSKRFDKFDLTADNYKVTKAEIDALAAKCDPKLAVSLEIAINRVRAFHENQKDSGFTYTDPDGNKMGQKVTPLEAIAVYVPGGRALYPSTVYMTVIPAIVAGVKRIVLISPPRTFVESPEVAKVIQLLGINEIYRIGGAQGVFAMAYGVAGMIEPVNKIVGPGNIYVAKAKQSVYGKIDIDMIAGPSEIGIIVDTDKNEDIPLIAMDMLSQAEHDPMARPILFGTNEAYLKKVVAQAESFLDSREIPLAQNAKESLANRGVAVCVSSINNAIAVSNAIAPEHLELFSDRASELLEQVTNAGSIFLGKYTPEAVGDYLGGPNHVLPTSGTAKFSSALGVYDYIKHSGWIAFSKESLQKYYGHIATIARSEDLYCHAMSAEIRFE